MLVEITPEILDYSKVENKCRNAAIILIHAMTVYAETHTGDFRWNNVPKWKDLKGNALEVTFMINGVQVPFVETIEQFLEIDKKAVAEQAKRMFDEFLYEQQEKIREAFDNIVNKLNKETDLGRSIGRAPVYASYTNLSTLKNDITKMLHY